MCTAMLFKFSIHIFLFLNVIIFKKVDSLFDSSPNPVPALKDEKAWILPRQITHLSHQMALREDGTTMMTGKNDMPPKQIIPPDSAFVGQKDRVFWRDWNYQFQNMAVTRDVDEFTKYLLAKNVHRKLAYAGDEICNKTSVDGFRFKQMFHEPMLPEEMQCYSCDTALLSSSDHLLSFHIIPSRVLFDASGKLIDFASRKEALSSDPSKSSRYPLFGELIHKFSKAQTWTGGDDKVLPAAQILQYFGGSRAEFEEKYSSLVEERNIAWVQTPSSFIRSGMRQRFFSAPNITTLWKKNIHEYNTTAVWKALVLAGITTRKKRVASPYDISALTNNIRNGMATDAQQKLEEQRKQVKNVWRSYGNGKTVQCVREVNGKLVPLDVILNVDTVVFDDETTEVSPTPQSSGGSRRKRATSNNGDQRSYQFTGNSYGMYESWRGDWVLPDTSSTAAANLKLVVAWEPYSCCSACCCSIEMCGLYATIQKCENIRSTKTRKGYLSLMKIDSTKEITLTVASGNAGQAKDLPDQDMRYKHLNELLNRYPYNEKGIPVHSSMLVDYRHEPSIVKLLQIFENMRKNSTDTEDLLQRTPGIYVQEVTCDNDEQKLDCHKLAECKGIKLEKKKVVVEEAEQQDPCDSEDELQIITISSKQNYFRMNEGDSYRFRLDASVFDTRKVKWKISLKTVPDYNVNIKCGEQRRARHLDGRDLLFTKLTAEDTNRRIEAKLDNGNKLLIVLNNNKEIDKYSANTTKVIIWGSVILGVVLLLMVFIVVVDRVRKRRIERVLKKKNKRLNEDDADVHQKPKPTKESSAVSASTETPTNNNNVTKTE